MSRNEQDRLRDIKDAIVTIHAHLAQAGEAADREDDSLLHDALLFQFVVIGEAVKNLAPETRDSEPEIPWATLNACSKTGGEISAPTRVYQITVTS